MMPEMNLPIISRTNIMPHPTPRPLCLSTTVIPRRYLPMVLDLAQHHNSQTHTASSSNRPSSSSAATINHGNVRINLL